MVSDRKHNKRPALESVLRMCGLATNKLSIPKMRGLLISLKGNKLPVSEKQVDQLLTNKHGQVIGGELFVLGLHSRN